MFCYQKQIISSNSEIFNNDIINVCNKYGLTLSRLSTSNISLKRDLLKK